MTEAEALVLPLMASTLAAALSGWWLVARALYHGRVVRVMGVWQGLELRGSLMDSPFRYRVPTVSYRCPVTQQQRLYVGMQSTAGRNWRRTGDPFPVWIDPAHPERPSGPIWPWLITGLATAVFALSCAWWAEAAGVSGASSAFSSVRAALPITRYVTAARARHASDFQI